MESLNSGESQGVEGQNMSSMDIDRMVNEGLGGGLVTMDNGLIEETTMSATGTEEKKIKEKGR